MEKLICELPHADYGEKGIEAIDFSIEKLPISQDQKKELTKNFLSGKGIIGRLPKSKKLILFTPDGMKIIKQKPKDKSMILPPEWPKYAIILKDQAGEIAMKKLELKEMIREEVRKLIEDKKIKFKLVCINGGRVTTVNTDARSAEIRKGDTIQIYRENQYHYFGSPTIQSGMRFKHDAGLSGKKIKNEFPDTTGMEVAIAKEHVGKDVKDSTFWATFKKK